MRFTITGKHIDITDALKAHAEDKTAKLPRYYNLIDDIEVIIDGSDGGKVKVEIIARAKSSKNFIVSESGEDAYSCIDIAVHKMERQLTKAKEKERDNKHMGNNENQVNP